MNEIWKPIPNYNLKYEVSSFGRVKSLKRKVNSGLLNSGYRTVKERILSQCGKPNHYLKVSLSGKSFSVHQLVAMAFLNHKPCGFKLVVDHIDGNKTNNNVSNLRIVTTRENLSNIKGSSTYVGVSWDEKYQKWRSRITINKKVVSLGHYNNEIDASKAYKLKLNNIKIL